MALIAVSGHPGCRYEEVARIAAQRLGFELLTQSRVQALAGEEFGADAQIPDKAYPSLVTSILARLATEHSHGLLRRRRRAAGPPFRGHAAGARGGAGKRPHRQPDARPPPGTAPRPASCCSTGSRRRAPSRKAKFGKSKATADQFDLVLNAESLTSEQMAELIETAVAATGPEGARLSFAAAEAQLQFQMRLKLARYGIVPPGQDHLAQQDVRQPERGNVRQPAGFLPHRLGIRAAQLSRAIRRATATCWKPSRPISICRSSIFTWN